MWRLQGRQPILATCTCWNWGTASPIKQHRGEREYQVTEKKEIQQDDWSYLMRYEDGLNRITMITCITGKPNMRLMVQATQK